jgi:thiamine-monophosphate kinase
MTAEPREHTPLGPGKEFDIIRGLLARWAKVSHGIGDDAALLDVPPGRKLVVTTDTSVENVHFRRSWLTSGEIGYRAGAAAISDLAAMAATPMAMTVALTLPESWREELAAIADGLAEVARDTQTPIVGGDLTAGNELALGITVLGTVAQPLARKGARTGDTVWVTGQLGGPLLAIRAWEGNSTPVPAHRARFAHPVPRLGEAQWLQRHGATAGLDCSDGVAADLAHIAAASHAQIVLHLERLPRVAGASPEDAARSGEEYELIVTAPAALDAAAFEREFGLALSAIGEVEQVGAGRAALRVLQNGRAVPVPAGHDHFAS